MLWSAFTAAVVLVVAVLGLISDVAAAGVHPSFQFRRFHRWNRRAFDRVYRLNLAARRPDLPMGRHERR